MDYVTRQSSPDFWIGQIFAAKSVRKGAVIRRSVRWIDREVGRARFFEEVHKRGFHLVQTGDQFVVICHNGTINLLF